jgi:ribose-phosphate pyrophosphokinase
MATRPLLFALPEYEYLADRVSAHVDAERGEVEVRVFPDGERYQRLASSVTNRSVIVLGGTTSDTATLMLYDLASAVVKYGAQRLTLIVPYFGYSTMERAVRTGEVVTAKTRARLLSSIPIASKGNRILLFDLHSEGIPHYFEGALTALHVRMTPLIVDLVRRVGGDNVVVASTDAGRAKWVETIASDLAADAAFVYKRRLSDSTTVVTAVSANVAGRNVVIYDDMIRTGGSLLSAAKAYRGAGAGALFAIASHAVFPGTAWERVRDSGVFDKVFCTDSHPNARRLEGEGLEIVSIAPLVASLIT